MKIKKKHYVVVAILADLLEGKLSDWAMVMKYKELNLRIVPELRKYLKECDEKQAQEQTLLTFIT